MAETKKSKAAANDGVFDVAKPGKSTPPSSAKPIIVTNRPVLKDPMVVDETDEHADANPTEETPAVAVPSVSKVKLAPLTPEEKGELPKAQEEAAANDDDAKDDTPDEPEDEPQADSPTEDEAAGDEVKKAAPEETEIAERKAAERQAELDKLAESRKYYLPINQVEKRRTKRYVVAGFVLIVLLGVVWGDIALDAGLVTIPGIKAPTHFFK